MLEVAILDLLEQQNRSIVPTLTSINRVVKSIGDGTIAGSQAMFLKNYTGFNTTDNLIMPNPGVISTGRPPRWMPISQIWMLDGAQMLSGVLGLSFNPATEVFTTEDSVRALEMYYEDNSGVIWALSNKAGYFGLWKRTGAGAWTQVLSDSAVGQYLAKWTNGALYYRSSTGNWYVISSGTANVTTDPGAATYSGWYQIANDNNRSWLPGYVVSVGPPDNISYVNTPRNRDDVSAYSEGKDLFWIWNWPARTRQVLKNAEVFNFIETNVESIVATPIVIYIPVVGSNYALQICVIPPAFSATAGTYLLLSVSIINLVSNQSQYLGAWKQGFLTFGGKMAATASGYSQLVPRMAVLNNGVIRLYYLGKLSTADATAFGYLREDITAKITV